MHVTQFALRSARLRTVLLQVALTAIVLCLLPGSANAAFSQLAGADGCVATVNHDGLCGLTHGSSGQMRDLALSPAGDNLYAVSTAGDGVLVYARNVQSGAVAQLSGDAGCVKHTTEAACSVGRGVRGAYAVAVSPDGLHVYVAGLYSDAVAVFARGANGRLVQLSASDGCVSSGGSSTCAPARAVDLPSDIAISPDGLHVYVTSSALGTISVFARNSTSGVLSQLAGNDGCLSSSGNDDTASGTCSMVRPMNGISNIKFSSDGLFAYGVSSADDAVLVLHRDAVTGVLTKPAGAAGCIATTSADGCTVGTGTTGAVDLVVSPDDQQVYVVTGGGQLTVLARDVATGAITHLSGAAGCHSDSPLADCTTARTLSGATAVDISNDGARVIVAGSGGIGVFSRDALTGKLSQAADQSGCFHPAAADGCADLRGINSPVSIAPSQDGEVYVGDLDSAGSIITLGSHAASCPNQTHTGVSGNTILITLGCGGFDPASVHYAVSSAPAHGTVGPIAQATGVADYTPAAGYTGPDSFAYIALDNAGNSFLATISIDVTLNAPSWSALPQISGAARERGQMNATTGTWTDTSPDAYSYQWQRCDIQGGMCNNVSGATAATYTLVAADIDKRMRVAVTATNSGGANTAVSNASVVIVVAAPTYTSSPLIMGNFVENTLLSQNGGQWTSSRPVSYSYSWMRCAADGTGCAAIAGATNSTYRLQAIDLGLRLRLRVTAANAGGTTGTLTPLTDPVRVAVPSVVTAPALSGTTRQATRVYTSNGSWKSTPSISLRYQWERCDASGTICNAIPGAVQSSYLIVAEDVDRHLRAAVTATSTAGATTARTPVSAPAFIPTPRVIPFAAKHTLASSVKVAWQTLAIAGVAAAYDVNVQSASATSALGTPVAWRSATALLADTFAMQAGRTYCFTVRARNSAARLSTWSAPQCITSALDDAAFSVTAGSWTRGGAGGTYANTLSRTSALNAKLSLANVQTKSIRIVASTCSTCGKVRVLWNGTLLGTVSLYSATARAQQQLGLFTLAGVRTGTLTLQVVSSGKAVQIDGVLLSKV